MVDVYCVGVNQIYAASFMFLCQPCPCLLPIHTTGLRANTLAGRTSEPADLDLARVQLKFSPAAHREKEKDLSQSISSVDWASLSDLPTCTGKAGSIDFIRHRSVGLSVCLSCIPDIPEPPLPACLVCFLCPAAPTVQLSPETVTVAAVNGINTCIKTTCCHPVRLSPLLAFCVGRPGCSSWQWAVMT